MKKITLKQFEKNEDDLYILYDRFTFWEFYKTLRKEDYDPEQALNFIFARCSLSVLIFQECIWNNKYKYI